MYSKDPVTIVHTFNDCINNQDIEGLSALMTENHVFIDRDGESHGPKSYMVEGWKRFFKMFPEYRNNFTKIESTGNRVFVLGHAFWSPEEPYDPVIWAGTLDGDLVAEWRVYVDTIENRKKFKLED